MPRRMVTNEIWYNDKFTDQSEAGRLLFLGIITNADDDGRLKASPRYLRHHIFPYDDNRTTDEVIMLRDKLNESGLIRVYSQNGKEYLDLPGWKEHQQIRRDRYKPSNIPPFDENTKPFHEAEPPIDNQTATNEQPIDTQMGDDRGRSLSQSKSSQSSLIKFNISQLRDDFLGVKDVENDLTDRLTLTLTEYMPAGRRQQMEAVKLLWSIFEKELDSNSFGLIYDALDKYSPAVLSQALIKAVHYCTGKRKPANYIRKILEEKSENNK